MQISSKSSKEYAPAGRLYSEFWSNLSKILLLGSYTLTLHRWGEICHGPLLRAKFHSHRCNVSSLQGEKLQNRPLIARLHDTAGCHSGCHTGCQTGLTTGLTTGSYNRFDNRYSRLSNRLSNGFDNRLNVCIHDTTGLTTGLTTGYIV